jgi:squalene-hopene/tetraprenyl-beta-curcumene cyclase
MSYPFNIQGKIAQIHQQINDLQQNWHNQVKLTLDATPSIHEAHPYLFVDAFPIVNVAEVHSLALAGALFANSVFIYDELLDQTHKMKRDLIPLSAQVMRFESYQILHHLFPPDAQFWNHFRHYIQEYSNACVEEYQFVKNERSWQEYTEKVALKIAIGKVGLSRISIAGLAEIAEDYEGFDNLTTSINYFNIASQMFDDFCDWKEDINHNIPSLLLARVIQEQGGIDLKNLKCQKKIAKSIYYGGHAHYVMELAIESLKDAQQSIANLPHLVWHDVIKDLRERCHILLQDIDQIVNSNIQRVNHQPKLNLFLPPAQSNWQELAWQGLSFLVKQWQRGFGEARHIMIFPLEIFKVTQEHQYGDIFQRALIADTFCDVDKLLKGELQPLINYEIKYLLNQQRNSGIGGWSYFPNLPDLSPDADDLAQIMQVFLRFGDYQLVENFCEQPLEVLLRDNSYLDGSFETWIIPKNQRNSEQERQDLFAKTTWGMGADNDVIANLLYALNLYDFQRFEETIKKGVNYLEKQQQADGSWCSTWYHGGYYGTFVCLRIITLIKPQSPTIQKSLDFLYCHQKEDGGWGIEEISDPLNTALALLALATYPNHREINLDCVDKALLYLQQSQEPDQGWSNCQFIRMELGRAIGKVHTILSYGSRTITTNFVTKAALCWHQLLNQ